MSTNNTLIITLITVKTLVSLIIRKALGDSDLACKFQDPEIEATKWKSAIIHVSSMLF